MQPVKGGDFLIWASGLGIGFDPRHPEAGCFCFLPPRQGCARYWTLAGDPATWPDFVAHFLDGVDPWATGFLWPREGKWPPPPKPSFLTDEVCAVVRRGAGIPEGWPGAVRFERTERTAIVAVLFAHLTFGGCVADDLYFIPDHGRQIIQTSHHDVVHVKCAEEDWMRQFVEHMAKAGHPLPTEPPDETFKRPSWMAGNGSKQPREAAE